MKAFVINKYGKKQVGELAIVPEPTIGDTDVLIQIKASSLNPVDTRIKHGQFRVFASYKFPLALGNDVAGVVVDVGSRVSRFKIGDTVYGRPPHDRIGSLAEFIAVDEAALAKIPVNLTMVEAAAIPLVSLTAWQALIDLAQVKAGQKVLIHSGSGEPPRGVRRLSDLRTQLAAGLVR